MFHVFLFVYCLNRHQGIVNFIHNKFRIQKVIDTNQHHSCHIKFLYYMPLLRVSHTQALIVNFIHNKFRIQKVIDTNQHHSCHIKFLYYTPLLRVSHTQALMPTMVTRFMVLCHHRHTTSSWITLFKFWMNITARHPQNTENSAINYPHKKECIVILLFIARVHVYVHTHWEDKWSI